MDEVQAIITLRSGKEIEQPVSKPAEKPENKRKCKTRENSNFLKKGKIVISVKIQNFSRSQMMKQTSLLKSSREI